MEDDEDLLTKNVEHCTRCGNKLEPPGDALSPDYRFWSDEIQEVSPELAAAPDVHLCTECLCELDKFVADFAFGPQLVGEIHALSAKFIEACEKSEKAVDSGAASAFEDNEHDLESQRLLNEAERLVTDQIKERADKLEAS